MEALTHYVAEIAKTKFWLERQILKLKQRKEKSEELTDKVQIGGRIRGYIDVLKLLQLRFPDPAAKVQQSEIIRAPWTPEQVDLLKFRQVLAVVHPYTCTCALKPNLIPSIDGWCCPKCDRIQDWAHDLDVDPEMLDASMKMWLSLSRNLPRFYDAFGKQIPPLPVPYALCTCGCGKIAYPDRAGARILTQAQPQLGPFPLGETMNEAEALKHTERERARGINTWVCYS